MGKLLSLMDRDPLCANALFNMRLADGWYALAAALPAPDARADDDDWVWYRSHGRAMEVVIRAIADHTGIWVV